MWVAWLAWLARDHPVRLFYLLYWLMMLTIAGAWFLFLYLT